MPRSPSSIAFHCTIQNPAGKGITHATLKAALSSVDTITYWAMGDHIAPTTGTPHIHLYLRFRNSTTFSRVKGLLPPGTHIEAAKGNSSQNVTYITKSGPRKDKDTFVAGSFEASAPNPPDDARRKMDTADVLHALEAGDSPNAILRKSPSLVKISRYKDLDELREIILSDQYGSQPREDLQVIYVQGSTRVGKTRGIYAEHSFEDTYRAIMSETHPFDTYSGQIAIMFDEFRDSIKLEKMLVYLDKLPCKLPARYNDRTAAYSWAYVVSNWPFEMQYANDFMTGNITQEDYAAWVARFSRIRVYTAYRTYDEYTVDDYFQLLDNKPVKPVRSVRPAPPPPPPQPLPPAVIALPAAPPRLALPPHRDMI